MSSPLPPTGATKASGSGAAHERPNVPSFEVIRELGRGPLGACWLCQTPMGREVALKDLTAAPTQHPDFINQFEKVTSALAALSHAQITPMVSRWVGRGTYALAMAYVPGGSLRQKLHGGQRLPVIEALRIALDASLALEHAHQRGLLHRDLKPENILVTGQSAQVTDFGLSQLRATSLPRSYAPPEARAQERPLDGRDDVYALAAILHEMLTGQQPRYPLEPLRNHLSVVDPRLQVLLDRALSSNPGERFTRAAELRASIAGLLPEIKAATPAAATSSGEIQIETHGGEVRINFPTGMSPEAFSAALAKVESAFRSGGPWKVIYDLSSVRALGVNENAQLIALHERCRAHLSHVTFFSPIAQVRGSALVVGGSVRGLKWKVFDGLESARRWLASPEASR